jgi:hypothetical protein
MLNKEQIFNLIQTNKAPFWELFIKENFYEKPKLLAKYDGDDVRDETDDESSITASLRALDQTLSIYNSNGILFSIKVRPKKTSNGPAILGPFTFSISGGNPSPQGNGYAPGNPSIGLGGVPGAPVADYGALGYIHKNQVTEMLAVTQERAQLMVEKALLERDKKALEEEKKEWEAEARDLIREHKDIAEIAQAAGKKGILEGFIQIGKSFIKGDLKNLSGTEEPKELTEEEKILQGLIDFINEQNYSIDELNGLVSIIKNVITKKEEEKE